MSQLSPVLLIAMLTVSNSMSHYYVVFLTATLIVSRSAKALKWDEPKCADLGLPFHD